MPVPSTQLPQYCHHKAKNRAFVRLSGRMIYLGRYGSAESRGEWPLGIIVGIERVFRVRMFRDLLRVLPGNPFLDGLESLQGRVGLSLTTRPWA